MIPSPKNMHSSYIEQWNNGVRVLRSTGVVVRGTVWHTCVSLHTHEIRRSPLSSGTSYILYSTGVVRKHQEVTEATPGPLYAYLVQACTCALISDACKGIASAGGHIETTCNIYMPYAMCLRSKRTWTVARNACCNICTVWIHSAHDESAQLGWWKPIGLRTHPMNQYLEIVHMLCYEWPQLQVSLCRNTKTLVRLW